MKYPHPPNSKYVGDFKNDQLDGKGNVAPLLKIGIQYFIVDPAQLSTADMHI
jgi:hypothetical protein